MKENTKTPFISRNPKKNLAEPKIRSQKQKMATRTCSEGIPKKYVSNERILRLYAIEKSNLEKRHNPKAFDEGSSFIKPGWALNICSCLEKRCIYCMWVPLNSFPQGARNIPKRLVRKKRRRKISLFFCFCFFSPSLNI